MIVKEDILKSDLKFLTKEELGSILNNELNIGKCKKNELIDLVIKKTKDNEILQKKIYKDYNVSLAIHPSKLEERLNITKTERKKMEEQGFLTVAYYDSVRMYGKYVDIPMFDRYEIYKITEEDIKKWRKKEELRKVKRKKKAVKKAIETRKKNESQYKAFYENEWPELLKNWYEKNVVLGATLQLAFWTVWLSRWAKYYQIKERRARTKGPVYRQKKEEFYRLKNESMKLLCNSPYIEIEFYEPEHPDKITNLNYCQEHYNRWVEERSFAMFGISVMDFFYENEEKIVKCPHCTAEIQEDYYSLYYLKIRETGNEDYHFSFHIPYPLGKEFLPSKKELPKVQNHIENEGMFRFGRSLTEEEEIIFKEKDVIKHFNESSQKLRLHLENSHEEYKN